MLQQSHIVQPPETEIRMSLQQILAKLGKMDRSLKRIEENVAKLKALHEGDTQVGGVQKD